VVLAASPSGGSLAFHGPEALQGGEWLSDDLAYRLRVGLSTVFGSGGCIDIGRRADSGAPALVLRFALQAQEGNHGGSD
jgi:hypothetical protein